MSATVMRASSLADAEARKYAPQQIVARKLAGDLVQRLLRLAQLVGHQLTRARVELRFRMRERRRGAIQRIEMPAPRDEIALGWLVPDALFQVLAQQLQACAGQRGKAQHRPTGLLADAG